MFIQYYCEKIASVFFVFIIVTMSCSAYSDTFDVIAEYIPYSYEHQGGFFVNKTPCKIEHNFELDYCDPKKPLESSTIIQFPVDIFRMINSRDGKLNYLSYYRTSGPKKITVKNDKDGSTYELKLVPTHIGVETERMALSGNHPTPMSRINGDCVFLTEKKWGNPAFSELLLHSIVPSAQGRETECYFKSPEGDIGYYWIDRIIYGFRLESPSPLIMSNGNYTGSILFHVGQYQDIDFGNGDYKGALVHRINIKLTVRHQLRVDFPKSEVGGKSNIVLLPPGGWNHWVNNRNRGPTFLQQDLPFRIWYSAPFTIALRCQYKWQWGGGEECALKDAKGRTVPLKTLYVDHRNVITNLTTRPYKIVPPVQGKPMINTANTIRFQVVGGTVIEMMKYPGSSFKGDVTLIFDAAID
ncbi:hypothetical protein NG896_21050 [Aeromonas veronii]|uniref:hypothetical protein n=1 Tax=Aeromonas veronii TaxID=654 RepID=UPI0020901D39|nr:hypothetical protein [Aeromonas veronii]MCO5345050.1 hypothetical protein [Aeromonas veronii]